MSKEKSKKDGEQSSDGSHKKMFCLYDKDEARLVGLVNHTSLTRSNLVQRAVAMLHDYVILRKNPDGSQREEKKQE